MGQFSWLDCKTGEQVLDNVPRNVYVLVPKEFGGGHITETCYDGYGRFDGKDIYDLVVDWNIKDLPRILENKDRFLSGWVEKYEDDFKRLADGKELADGLKKRTLGIAIACYDEDNAFLRYPIKITHDPNATYEHCNPSLSDPDQGWLRECEYDWQDESLEVGYNPYMGCYDDDC